MVNLNIVSCSHDYLQPLASAYGLAKHRDGRWEWAIAPGVSPSPRYQHAAVGFGFLKFYLVDYLIYFYKKMNHMPTYVSRSLLMQGFMCLEVHLVGGAWWKIHQVLQVLDLVFTYLSSDLGMVETVAF